MCDLCTKHNALIDTLFTALGKSATNQGSIPIALAALMAVEATKAERGRTPQDMPTTEMAGNLVKRTTAEHRNDALHFLAMLKNIVTTAGNTLATAKHTLGDADAEERAPGFGAAAAQVKAMTDPLASIFGPAAKKPDNPRWN